MRQIYLCLPVHNEEKNLEKCIRSIQDAIKFIQNYRLETFICLNDCEDSSQEVALSCKQKYSRLNIKILKSKKGKLNAQEKVLSQISSRKIIFFIDSDTEIDNKSMKIILDEFKKHKELIAVGAFPIAKKYRGFNLWKKLLDNILNIRSRHPMSEISKLKVEEYHNLARTDPQNINTSQEHELKSKIFFMGECLLCAQKNIGVSQRQAKK